MKRYIKSLIALITVFSICSTMIMEYCIFEVEANTSLTVSENVYVEEDFSSSTKYDEMIKAENGWTATGTKWGIKNQKLRTTGSVSATCNTQFSNGYIESDIAIEQPSSSFEQLENGKQESPASLVARCSASAEHEIRVRFRVKKEATGPHTVYLQTVYYNKTDFGKNAVTYDYTIPNFEYNKEYAVRLACIGNYVEVSLDGVVIEQFCFKDNSAMASRQGSFGILGAGGKVPATFDNVKIAECSTYQIQIAEENQDHITVEGFKDPKVATVTKRNAFCVGETVKLITNPPEAMEVDTMLYTSNQTGEVRILKGSDKRYSFVMPATDIQIQSNFKTKTETVYVEEDFSSSTKYDEMIKEENGWKVVSGGAALRIKDEKLRAVGSATVNCTTQFANGYIEADVAIESPTDIFEGKEDGTKVYPASLVARCSTTGEHEIRVRFRVTKEEASQYSVILQTVYFNKTDFGKNAVTYDYEIPDFEFNKDYKVRLACIGNYVEVSLDDVVKEQFCFKENSAMDSRIGSFGILTAGNVIPATFDNVKIVERGTYQIQIENESKEYVEVASFKDPKVSTVTQRNAFQKDEQVDLTVTSPRLMEPDVISYNSVATGKTIISKSSSNKYSFVMPATDIKINATYKEIDDTNITEMLYVDANFNASNEISKVFAKDQGWSGYTGTKPTIRDGKLYCSDVFSANAATDFIDGYIEADITIETPSKVLSDTTEKKTVYTGNMSARKTDSKHEIRSRFAITYNPETQKYSVDLHTIYYDLEDYGDKAKFRSYSLSDFEFGKTYKVRLTTIGNYVEVSLNDIVVQQFCFAEGNTMIDRKGTFGISTTKDSAEVSFDNIRIAKNRTASVSVEKNAASFIYMDSYADPSTSVKGVHQRNRFVQDEFVMVNLTFPDGYALEEDSLIYKANSEDIAITAKDSDTLYAFSMPKTDAVVSGKLVRTAATTGKVWFCDHFDEESLMTERGWNKNVQIVNGYVYMDYTDTSDVQLTGISSAKSWEKYVVECDLTLDRESFQTSGCVALCFMNNSNQEGYEFGITSSTGPDAGYFRLYDRTAKEFLATSEAGTAVAGQKYHLLAAVSEKKIECYVDGKLMFSVANPKSNPYGTIGLRMHKAVGLVDNVMVRENDVLSNAIVPSPQTGDYNAFGFSLCMLVASGWVLTVAMRGKKIHDLNTGEEKQ